MPTLIVENMPVEVYERLQERAAAGRRSLPEEMLHLLNQWVLQNTGPAPRWRDFIPGEEIAAPCDRPRSSQPERMLAALGQPRMPDPLGGGSLEVIDHDLLDAGAC